jgi:hypothetical protein
MTLAIPAHDTIRTFAVDGYGEAVCVDGSPRCDAESSPMTTALARLDALARGAATALVDMKTRWRPSEDEIVRAAITVILVALGTIIALAAGAAVTVG